MKKFSNLEMLVLDHEEKRSAIQQRLQEYKEIPVKKYFYELLYCLMTPQSSAVNAAKAQRMFESLDYQHASFDPEPLLHQKEYYIRFHRSKGRWIAEMKENFQSILETTTGPMRAFEKREWFVKNVKGLSYKEATHFLRNIGKNEGLAILDRHILRNLKFHNIIRSLPETVTRKRYLHIEKKFQAFAGKIGISVDELDLLFWSKETGEILK